MKARAPRLIPWPVGPTVLGLTLLLLLLLLSLRVAAPFAIEAFMNRELAQLENYTGSVGDVDLALWRGAYRLRDLRIEKRHATTDEPFIFTPRIEAHLQWRALLRLRIVGELDIHGLKLSLIAGRTPRETQLGEGVDWREHVERLYPFQLNRIELHNAEIGFRAPGISTTERLHLSQTNVTLLNLSNVDRTGNRTYSRCTGTGTLMHSGHVEFLATFDPLPSAQPIFDLNLSVEDLPLVEVNPWLNEYAKVTAEAGSFSVYTELATADGRFSGYVKPIMQRAEFFELDEEGSNPFRVLWEGLVSIASELLENQPADQLATRIPLSGQVEDPDADVLASIGHALENALGDALSEALDRDISLGALFRREETEEDEREPG